MSVRSLIELNHDYEIDDRAIEGLREYRRSAQGESLTHGFRCVGQYHHSNVVEHKPAALYLRMGMLRQQIAAGGRLKRAEVYSLILDLQPLLYVLVDAGIEERKG